MFRCIYCIIWISKKNRTFSARQSCVFIPRGIDPRRIIPINPNKTPLLELSNQNFGVTACFPRVLCVVSVRGSVCQRGANVPDLYVLARVDGSRTCLQFYTHLGHSTYRQQTATCNAHTSDHCDTVEDVWSCGCCSLGDSKQMACGGGEDVCAVTSSLT